MRLVIINGPCGVGKSTVAKALHLRMPGSFLLDMDGLRRCVSNYREDADASRALSMRLAHIILATCFAERRDVILERMLFKDETLDAFRAVAQEHGAQVDEVILWASKETVMARAAARGYRDGGLLTPEKCERFWHEIDALRRRRPIAQVIDIDRCSEDEALEKVCDVLQVQENRR